MSTGWSTESIQLWE